MTRHGFGVLDAPRSATSYRGLYCGTAWPLALSANAQARLGLMSGLSLAASLDGVRDYVASCAAAYPKPRVVLAEWGFNPGNQLPSIPLLSMGYDVCIPSFYSLVHQSVLLGVPQGTRASSLRPSLNRFGLFDGCEDAERLRGLWKEHPDEFDAWDVDDVEVLRLYWVLSLPGCDVELSQPEPPPAG